MADASNKPPHREFNRIGRTLVEGNRLEVTSKISGHSSAAIIADVHRTVKQERDSGSVSEVWAAG